MTRSIRPKIVHAMCDSSSAVIVEIVEKLPTGQAVIVDKCMTCGRTEEPRAT